VAPSLLQFSSFVSYKAQAEVGCATKKQVCHKKAHKPICAFLWLKANRAMLESIARMVKVWLSQSLLFIPRHLDGPVGDCLVLACIPDMARLRLKYRLAEHLRLSARSRAEPSVLNCSHHQSP
jgi:hypothetical protein